MSHDIGVTRVLTIVQPALERSASGAAERFARGRGAVPPHSDLLRAARGLPEGKGQGGAAHQQGQ